MSANGFLLIDDEDVILNIGSKIENSLNIEAYLACSFTGANDRLLDEPGIDHFRFILLDLAIPYDVDDFTEEEINEIRRISIHCSKDLSGWVWAKNYLMKLYPDFPRNQIIIFSSYISALSSNELRLHGKDIILIDKTSSDSMNNLLKTMRNIVPRRL